MSDRASPKVESKGLTFTVDKNGIVTLVKDEYFHKLSKLITNK